MEGEDDRGGGRGVRFEEVGEGVGRGKGEKGREREEGEGGGRVGRIEGRKV